MRTNVLQPRSLSGSRSTICLGTAVTLFAILLISLASSPQALAATTAPPLLWQVPKLGPGKGAGAGEINRPRGIAVDSVTGDVFLVDRDNARIDQFTAWGEFVKAFGWNVDAASPAEELQTCTAETGCKAGSKGGGAGQFNTPAAVAIDSDEHIYVAEEKNHRVQVFDQEGAFLFMFGGKVNKTKVEASAPTAEQNRCPVDPADTCQAGQVGTGPGEFSISDGNGFELAGYLAIGPGDTLYAGDVERIQKFSAQGLFQGEISGSSLSGEIVSALEVDPDGNLYATLENRESTFGDYSLIKLGPAGEILHNYPVASSARVGGLALGRASELYAVLDPAKVGSGEVTLEPRVVEFDAAGGKLLPTEDEEEAEAATPRVPPFAQVALAPNFSLPTTINDLAVSGACGLDVDDIFASYNEFTGAVSLLRAYGPAPDPTICPPPPFPPEIEDTYASSVGPDGATVTAKINPRFQSNTTYYVQYGTGKCSEGGCASEQPLAPGAKLSSRGSFGVKSPVFLSGLAPGTEYHYRFVAAGDGGGPVIGPEETFTTLAPTLAAKNDCPNQSFRVGLSANLPDCRAYEMVSPVEKEGADIVAVNAVVTEVPARLDQSATSGERLTYSAYRAFADPKSAPYTSQFLSSRSVAGWSTESISPPRGEPLESVLETGDTEYLAFTDDLCNGWLALGFVPEPQLDPNALTNFPNLFRRESCGSGGGAYDALTTVEPPHLPESKRQYFNPQVQGVSADGRCTVFRTPDTLTSEAPIRPLLEKENILYEDCDGTLRLVAILPDGTPSQSSSTAGAGIEPEDFVETQLRRAGTYSAVSKDGTSIYWTAPGEGPGALYLRINADQPQSAVAAGKCTEAQMACTLPVSGLVPKSDKARFWTASADGTRAFFSVEGKLYEYVATNPAKPKATLVAEGVTEGTLGMLGSSENLSRVYFASAAVLAPGAVAKEPNLYLLEGGESPRFIGILDPSDLNRNFLESRAISYQPGFRAARVSPDGRYAAFASNARLTGFNNNDQRNGVADREVFLYDAEAEGGQGKLVCVSCDPSGARPVGKNITFSESRAPVWAAARIPTWTSSLYPGNPLTSEGSGARLFFDSYVPLVPRDTNGKGDVYEWQSAESQAGCEAAGAERYAASSHGCLSLISSGQSPQDSEFLDADPSGKNVFFATGQSMLPQDSGLIDIYVAREGGGLPPPPSKPAACEGEACQSPAEPPNDPTPASAAFNGAGNVRKGAKPPKSRCAKAKVRRKGRCVAKHPHKRSQKQSKRRNHR